MAIEFPGNFFIAKEIRVEIIQAAPVNKWSALAGHRLQTPVDRITETKTAKAQEIELTFRDSIGSLDDVCN